MNRKPAVGKNPVPQNALSEKAEFYKKMLAQAVQKHIEFFLKGDADLLETMSILETQLTGYCMEAGRVDDLIVYNQSSSGEEEDEGDDHHMEA